VLLVHYGGRSLLLTGDLEGPGLQRVLALPAPAIDVLLAPHHGSRTSNTPELAAWAKARVVVSSQRPATLARPGREPFSAAGAWFFSTGDHGAVTVRGGDGPRVIETFKTGQRLVLPAAPARASAP
jgi:competence protein ComEC